MARVFVAAFMNVACLSADKLRPRGRGRAPNVKNNGNPKRLHLELPRANCGKGWRRLEGACTWWRGPQEQRPRTHLVGSGCAGAGMGARKAGPALNQTRHMPGASDAKLNSTGRPRMNVNQFAKIRPTQLSQLLFETLPLISHLCSCSSTPSITHECRRNLKPG